MIQKQRLLVFVFVLAQISCTQEQFKLSERIISQPSEAPAFDEVSPDGSNSNDLSKAWLLAGDQQQLNPLNELWVDDDGLDAAAHGISFFFTDLQEALRQSSLGATIRVLPGFYQSATFTIPDKSLKLIAMKNKVKEVNADADPNISEWPVMIRATGGNGFQTAWGADNLTIRGFYILSAGFNGIYIKPNVQNDINGERRFIDYNENVSVQGNRIEETAFDGIKAHQALALRIEGNRINNWSRNWANKVKGADLEHAIDFVSVGNSVIRNNLIIKGAIGMTVKSGSVNVLIEKNQFVGPIDWVSLSMGEGCNTEPGKMIYSSWASPGVCNYQTKSVVVRNNIFTGGEYDLNLYGCQNCTLVQNTYQKQGIQMKDDYGGFNQNVCIDESAKVTEKKGYAPTEAIQRRNCNTKWDEAKKVKTIFGDYDLQ